MTGPPIEWGSDAVAEVLRRQGFAHIALNPGASYRGLHDSIVNYLGNEDPAILICLHEEHAVALAHGYAKVTEQPLAVALHSNVGLMHATMAIFNAFCDRVPMLILGATGPVDAAERRPWIDWIHTAADQGALIRNYVKWDDQPASAQAAVDSLARADMLTRAYPPAPVYVCLDAAMQEAPLDDIKLPELDRHQPPAPAAPRADDLDQAVAIVASAARPLFLVGRVRRSTSAWDERVQLVERLGARVLTDLKVGAGFPSGHPANPAAPGTFLTASGAELIRAADAIVALDWVDLGGTLRQAYGAGERVTAQVVSCTTDHVLHNGWSKDHFELPPVDLAIAAHPDELVTALLGRVTQGAGAWPDTQRASGNDEPPSDETIGVRRLAQGLRSALAGHDASIVRLPLAWDGADLEAAHPRDYLGQDGGGGLGSGPGMTIGAALALQGSSRLAVGVLGDGDFLMGANALWTAARHDLPLLIVVANNRSFFNDEVHQERVANQRGRPAENKGVGQQIRDPDPDLAALARSLGLNGHGPVTDPAELDATLATAAAEAVAGAAVVVDVRIIQHTYPGGPAPTRSGS